MTRTAASPPGSSHTALAARAGAGVEGQGGGPARVGGRRAFSSSLSLCVTSVGNLPALFRPGPSSRGICLITDSDARKAAYFLAARARRRTCAQPHAHLHATPVGGTRQCGSREAAGGQAPATAAGGGRARHVAHQASSRASCSCSASSAPPPTWCPRRSTWPPRSACGRPARTPTRSRAAPVRAGCPRRAALGARDDAAATVTGWPQAARLHGRPRRVRQLDSAAEALVLLRVIVLQPDLQLDGLLELALLGAGALQHACSPARAWSDVQSSGRHLMP